MGAADTGASRLYYVGKGEMATVDLRDLGQFRQVVAETPDANYAWAIFGRIKVAEAGSYDVCVASDDGSQLYIDGASAVDNEGLHGVVEKCATLTLAKGLHSVYIEGFQAWGGVWQDAKYKGPDTGVGKVLMQAGRASSRYFPACDPTDKTSFGPDQTLWTVCMFKSASWLSFTPRIGDAVAQGQLSFVGKGQLGVVDLHDVYDFRQAAVDTPDVNYAWAMYGNLKVVKEGSYNLCIVSDDGWVLWDCRLKAFAGSYWWLGG
jgi:hypothetical protein